MIIKVKKKNQSFLTSPIPKGTILYVGHSYEGVAS